MLKRLSYGSQIKKKVTWSTGGLNNRGVRIRKILGRSVEYPQQWTDNNSLFCFSSMQYTLFIFFFQNNIISMVVSKIAYGMGLILPYSPLLRGTLIDTIRYSSIVYVFHLKYRKNQHQLTTNILSA
jgi:hypothetical protein